MSNAQCPLCGANGMKALYMAIPLRLCAETNCNCVFGPLAWLMDWLPFNGWFMKYDGAYLPALWHWLTRPLDDE